MPASGPVPNDMRCTEANTRSGLHQPRFQPAHTPQGALPSVQGACVPASLASRTGAAAPSGPKTFQNAAPAAPAQHACVLLTHARRSCPDRAAPAEFRGGATLSARLHVGPQACTDTASHRTCRQARGCVFGMGAKGSGCTVACTQRTQQICTQGIACAGMVAVGRRAPAGAARPWRAPLGCTRSCASR